MPDVGLPDSGRNFIELMASRGDLESEQLALEWAALDVRHLGNSPDRSARGSDAPGPLTLVGAGQR